MQRVGDYRPGLFLPLSLAQGENDNDYNTCIILKGPLHVHPSQPPRPACPNSNWIIATPEPIMPTDKSQRVSAIPPLGRLQSRGGRQHGGRELVLDWLVRRKQLQNCWGKYLQIEAEVIFFFLKRPVGLKKKSHVPLHPTKIHSHKQLHDVLYWNALRTLLAKEHQQVFRLDQIRWV